MQLVHIPMIILTMMLTWLVLAFFCIDGGKSSHVLTDSSAVCLFVCVNVYLKLCTRSYLPASHRISLNLFIFQPFFCLLKTYLIPPTSSCTYVVYWFICNSWCSSTDTIIKSIEILYLRGDYIYIIFKWWFLFYLL